LGGSGKRGRAGPYEKEKKSCNIFRRGENPGTKKLNKIDGDEKNTRSMGVRKEKKRENAGGLSNGKITVKVATKGKKAVSGAEKKEGKRKRGKAFTWSKGKGRPFLVESTSGKKGT